jgi:hypothetical protein
MQYDEADDVLHFWVSNTNLYTRQKSYTYKIDNFINPER